MLRYSKSAVSFVGRVARRASFSKRTPVAAAGLALGFGGWAIAQNFAITFGFTHETNTALLLAAAVGVLLGHVVVRRVPSLPGTGLAAILAAACLVLLPSITGLAMSMLDALPANFLTNPWLRLVCLTGAALLVVGLPAACCAVIVAHRTHRTHASILLVTGAFGLLSAALLAGPSTGLMVPALAIAGLTGLGWIVRQWRGADNDAEETFRETAPEHVGFSRWLATAATVLAAGAGVGVLSRLLAQLMPEAPYLVAAGGAVLLLAVVGGVACRRRVLRDGGRSAGNMSLMGALVIACGLLLPLAAFEKLVWSQLNVNAYVSSVALLVAIRMGLVALCLLPVGFGLGLGGHVSRGASAGTAAGFVLFCCGLAASAWLIPVTGVAMLAVIIAGLMTASNLPAYSVPSARRWRTALGVGAATCLCIGLGVAATRYAPTRSAQLLFDAHLLISWKRGVPERLLTVLDDTRLISVAETRNGTLTAWRSRGVAVSLRLDGIPLAMTTSQPERSPLPSAEVLPVLLPIVLHDDPESLLLLSDPAGVAIETALRFPLRRVVAHNEIAFGSAAKTLRSSPPEDERLTCHALDPRLAVLAEDERYDIIVSAPGHPAIPQNATYFTQAFYGRAAGCLTADGIFCQRVRFSDFGPEPLRVISRTMEGAFVDVMAVELGGGEIALLGTRTDATLIGEGLIERLRRPHVRRALANLGWDWSMPFNLKTIPADKLSEFATAGGRANTAMSGRLGHRLPYEMMRWGPKGAELQQATAKITVPLVALGAPAEEQKDILERIKVVSRQHEMMTRYPDQPWAYRQVVRKHLKDSPRSVIEKIDGDFERILHPEEQRRVNYFKALGVAIRKLDEPSLAELEAFAEPYDPLLTYFLHHEIAPLYEQLGAKGRSRELSHRLHAAYFADPRDRSIRNIVASINLLVDHPQVVSSSSARFDELNGLIELLLTRWETRGAAIPQSPGVAMVDVDKSLDALVKVLPAMEKLAPRAGITAEQWKNRSDAIERTLNRPLRKYRATLMPHIRTAQRKSVESQTVKAVPQMELP